MRPRIIGGEHRGRVLVTPPGLKTRPTAARVREALFSILGRLDGKNVADLCAGTGALGLEALSRGAARVVFVDPDRNASAAIEENLRALRLEDRGTLIRANVERSKRVLSSHGPFDLVLCDPPWPQAQQVADQLAVLFADDLLHDGGFLVIGHRASAPVSLDAATWRADDRRQWGDSGLSWFVRRHVAESKSEKLEPADTTHE